MYDDTEMNINDNNNNNDIIEIDENENITNKFSFNDEIDGEDNKEDPMAWTSKFPIFSSTPSWYLLFYLFIFLFFIC